MQKPTSTGDVLASLQLSIARRADELARARQTHTSMDLDCWLIAEAEIFRQSPLLPFAPAPVTARIKTA